MTPPSLAAESRLLTAEEFAALPADGRKLELVLGRIREMNAPRPRHGEVAAMFAILIGSFVVRHKLGRVMTNDSGVITTRNPDSVRGPDFAYFSAARVAGDRLPSDRYSEEPPDLVVEVVSPRDRWLEIIEKTGEYLRAGVRVVCIADPVLEQIHIYEAEQSARILNKKDAFALPALLPNFTCPVSDFFA